MLQHMRCMPPQYRQPAAGGVPHLQAQRLAHRLLQPGGGGLVADGGRAAHQDGAHRRLDLRSKFGRVPSQGAVLPVLTNTS